MISNGASVTFTVTIDDQDDFYHFYCWTVDGESCGDSESLTFSKSPDVEQSYIITVAVSDGKDLVSASSVITVQDKPWGLNRFIFTSSRLAQLPARTFG
ncbi:hypothetical protein [Oceanispirochaeta sp.]|uniref:hypothetical protein n=1 Tax=Oceanispirochaeta sp. TaxID=2035350 RepID=UPI00261DE34A|nr:hypothetical protein [Oceanispirochaeta sp.]MDA3957967.1 hypothetical protein [Oceanispirochaeta sp.]